MKKDLKYYLALGVCAAVAVLLHALTPTPLNWSPSFSAADKIPYGNYILLKVLPHIFPQRAVNMTEESIFKMLKERSFEQTNYIFVNSGFAPDEVEAEILLDFVAVGNHVFIAAEQFAGKLADTLKIETERNFLRPDSVGVNFAQASLKSERYRYKTGTAMHYFSSFDTTKTVVLGVNDRDQVNFIKLRWGQGNLLLSSIPLAFTNYNMLAADNGDYVVKALSHLPVQDTFWDEYYKVSREVVATPIRYILSRAPLKWALCLVLAALVLYIVFEGKRRQRVIAVIEPLPNHTLEFVETVGRLYYQQGDHKNIAAKKVKYFLEHVRTHLGVDLPYTSAEWPTRVAEKMGKPAAQIAELCDDIKKIDSADMIADEELAAFNRRLETFHHERV